MASELIRLDPTHIFVEQLRMPVDRVLQCYIRNMSAPPLPLIENYLREAGFWHVATIGRGCKLDPKLISGLIERIKGGRIEMGWLRDTFLEPDDDSTELELIRYARPYILQIIGGYLMPDLSRNLVHLRWLLKLVDFRAAGELSWGSTVLATLYREMCGATFEWTPYDDPAIRAVIPDEFFQNPNIWHVKVPMVTYAIVEMHQSDRVLRQFGFRQPILVTFEKLDDEHEIDLQHLNTDWPRYWLNYIKIWENWYDYIPTREPIIVPELAGDTITGPINNTPIVTGPISSTNDTHITTFSDYASPMAGWNVWPNSSLFPITLAQPPIYRPPSYEGSHESSSGSSSFYQTPSPYGILQPPSPWMM
ncbi:hypothetical protein J1N35_023270 [Gossypium stocksii]|uniref:Aminotransferase-like plant mobile domain-containing protein n=1 Tax=Gossypium stocksii TaxID=47602 RepID=A0A9D3VK05_9ROSI|nr:hypothetical protein J1N35_023270 [Gossypium stocksii]